MVTMLAPSRLLMFTKFPHVWSVASVNLGGGGGLSGERRKPGTEQADDPVGDSHDVAIASYDGRVYRWQTDRDRAVDFACRMAGRDLTHEEWQQLLPAQPYRSVCPDA